MINCCNISWSIVENYNMKKEIKISFKNEIKRFEIPPTFKELRETILKCFKQVKDSEFLITYLDDEQDNVVISNEFDLEQVFMFMEKQKINLLRAFLEVAKAGDFEKSSLNTSVPIINSINEDLKINDEKKEEELKKEEVQDSSNVQKPQDAIIQANQEIPLAEENKVVIKENIPSELEKNEEKSEEKKKEIEVEKIEVKKEEEELVKELKKKPKEKVKKEKKIKKEKKLTKKKSRM
jgi:hypothetical protein